MGSDNRIYCHLAEDGDYFTRILDLEDLSVPFGQVKKAFLQQCRNEGKLDAKKGYPDMFFCCHLLEDIEGTSSCY